MPTDSEKNHGAEQIKGQFRKLPKRDAAQHHRQAQDGQNGHQPIDGVERVGRQLSADHVIALEIGQEKQAQRPFPFFGTDAIGGGDDADEEGKDKGGDQQIPS